MYCVIIAIIIIIVIIIIKNPSLILIPSYKNSTYLQSHVDNHYYRVSTNYDDTQTAADKLGMLNNFNMSLIQYIKDKCSSSECSNMQKKINKNLSRRYTSNSLIEHTPEGTKETAYSQFKGKIMAFCLRNQNNNSFIDNSTLQFVDLHEMAHVASNGYGHGDEFWNIFKQILVEATESNIYEPVDYTKAPVNYCGLVVSHNPYYD